MSNLSLSRASNTHTTSMTSSPYSPSIEPPDTLLLPPPFLLLLLLPPEAMMPSVLHSLTPEGMTDFIFFVISLTVDGGASSHSSNQGRLLHTFIHMINLRRINRGKHAFELVVTEIKYV